MNRITLYLDCDGVLNKYGGGKPPDFVTVPGRSWGIHASMRDKCLEFISKNNLQVVLASSARYIPEYVEFLKNQGFNFVGYTDNKISDVRLYEIEKDIKAFDVDRFIILDDDGSIPHYGSDLIKSRTVTPLDGMTDEDWCKAQDIVDSINHDID